MIDIEKLRDDVKFVIEYGYVEIRGHSEALARLRDWVAGEPVYGDRIFETFVPHEQPILYTDPAVIAKDICDWLLANEDFLSELTQKVLSRTRVSFTSDS